MSKRNLQISINFMRFRTLSVLAFGLIGVLWASAAEPDVFYTYNHQKVALTVDENNIAVKLLDEAGSGKMTSDIKRRDFAASATSAGYKEEEVYALRRGGWLGVRTGKAKTYVHVGVRGRALVQRLAESLTTIHNVRFVSPILFDGRGNVALVEPTLLIGFLSGTPPETQQAILRRITHVDTMIERNAKHGQWLVQTRHKNGLDVLDAANALAELPEVAYAEPDFLLTIPAELRAAEVAK